MTKALSETVISAFISVAVSSRNIHNFASGIPLIPDLLDSKSKACHDTNELLFIFHVDILETEEIGSMPHPSF